MRLRIPTPPGIDYTLSHNIDHITITDTEIYITNIDSLLDENSNGVLHTAYEYLTETTNTITPDALTQLKSYISDGPTPRLDYQNKNSEWVLVTNPAFNPREPITQSNSPFTHGDVIATPNNHRFRFTGWQHSRPIFTRAGTPIGAQRHRIELSTGDALIGDTQNQTFDDVLNTTF